MFDRACYTNCALHMCTMGRQGNDTGQGRNTPNSPMRKGPTGGNNQQAARTRAARFKQMAASSLTGGSYGIMYAIPHSNNAPLAHTPYAVQEHTTTWPSERATSTPCHTARV